MSPGQNEDRIFAQLERRLLHDDPALAATMAALNDQFSDVTEVRSTASPGDSPPPRSRRLTVVAVLTAIAVLGLILTALLNSSPHQAEDDPEPTRGLGVSTHADRRFAQRTTPRRRSPGRGTDPRHDAPPTEDRREGTRALALVKLRSTGWTCAVRPVRTPELAISPVTARRRSRLSAVRYLLALRGRRPVSATGARPPQSVRSGGTG